MKLFLNRFIKDLNQVFKGIIFNKIFLRLISFMEY